MKLKSFGRKENGAEAPNNSCDGKEVEMVGLRLVVNGNEKGNEVEGDKAEGRPLDEEPIYMNVCAGASAKDDDSSKDEKKKVCLYKEVTRMTLVILWISILLVML